jgi:hypothetical protein
MAPLPKTSPRPSRGIRQFGIDRNNLDASFRRSTSIFGPFVGHGQAGRHAVA